jgi:hypothetical protein
MSRPAGRSRSVAVGIHQRVVTPHAAFLALLWAPRRTLANLARLERDFDIYDRWGFRDGVNVDSGVVPNFYLSLDQGMIMAAIGNALAGDMLRRAFVSPRFEQACGRSWAWRNSAPTRAAARSRAAAAPTGYVELRATT